MEPPTPPTDSLYKFIALSGLAISIVTVSLMTVEDNNIRDREFSAREQEAVLRVELDDLNHKIDLLQARRNDLQRTRDRLDARYRTFTKQAHQYIKHAVSDARQSNRFRNTGAEIIAQQSDIKWHDKQIENAAEKIAATFFEQRKKNATLEAKVSELDSLLKEARNDLKYAAFMMTLGGLMGLSGFASWYFCLQRYLDDDTITANRLGKVNLDTARVTLKKAQLDLEVAQEVRSQPETPAPQSLVQCVWASIKSLVGLP
ncbi:MAG: hypothetical protein JWL77_4101 [Chthonomonadaceae bacterium]|nr:hypothetical protein [Chthonomonadaceae bacterium]